jgi:sugar phosphate isomerase/epimerase
MNRWCKLSILTDEVSQDLDAVLRCAHDFKLDGIELRSLFGKAFKDLSRTEIRQVADACRHENLAVSGCASPVFKCAVDNAREISEHLDLFKRSLDAALDLGTDLVRVFTFLRRGHPTSSDDLARAAEPFPRLLDTARGSGVRIGVENEASCLVGSGAEMREFLGHLPADPQLGVVWDPCNVLYLDGENDPVRDDFPLLADRTIHVHVKDARRNGTKAPQSCVELGTGSIDFPAHFTDLKARGYRGWITLETHWRVVPLDEESQHLPAGHAFSAHAEPASRVCLGHLQRFVDAA